MRIKPKYSIDRLPGIFDKRAFIGGSFDNIPRLEEIYKVVMDCGFTPIFSLEFGIPKEEIRHYLGRLVAQCKYAIFETSEDAGYFFEMEDAKYHSLVTLCLIEAYHGGKTRTSSMALAHDVYKNNHESYKNIPELRSYVYKFLGVRR